VKRGLTKTMASEDKGEWKLLKVWQCKKCKLLINDGRQVYDHVCTVKEEEDKLLALRKIIYDRDASLEERDKFIDSQRTKIDALNKRTEGLEHFITELNIEISSRNNMVGVKDGIIEEQKIAIEEYKVAIEGHKAVIEECNESIDDHKKTIDRQHAEIEEQNLTIENQKKNQVKFVEKVVYLEKGISTGGNDSYINDINVDILQKDAHIKDSKDSGYREEIEVEIFERGKGKEKIIIKNGKVIKKPDDIVIIGKKTPEGFIVKGIYRN
jgi:chromosome segregation ATPase